jgi:UDP-N-acetylmuramoyl-L-alanyl-D-glutamate--2,6-diaminopimelate ligase
MNLIQLPSIYKVAVHTDHVGEGSTFIAIPGTRQNGVGFIEAALDKGAREIVVELGTDLPEALVERCEENAVDITFCSDARAALACLSALAYDYPADKLKIIAVTGTKGKSTSVYLLYHILRTAGKNVALLSGIENKINDQVFPSELTTAQPDYLHMFFDTCVKNGVEYVVMEAAAQAFSLHRLDTIEFDAALFTNFSMEHAEFYTNIEDYFEAKKLIFEHCKSTAITCLNADDSWVSTVASELIAPVLYSLRDKSAQYVATIEQADMSGVTVGIAHAGEVMKFTSQMLVGNYNVYNLLGVVSLAVELGIHYELIEKAVSTFTGVPGRLERFITKKGVHCIVDYAHNPSSYEALLSMLAQHTTQLIVVFGCGGDRAHDKRPVMGALASAYAHHVVLTTDNPRSENVDDIIAHIMSGISDVDKVFIELDRAKAIKYALSEAQPGSIVAVLGKGPDEYQHIGSVKTFFSDRQEVKKYC